MANPDSGAINTPGPRLEQRLLIWYTLTLSHPPYSTTASADLIVGGGSAEHLGGPSVQVGGTSLAASATRRQDRRPGAGPRWEQSNQTGTLIELVNVQELNRFGGFDLVIGGSPCNNLTGSNRYTRGGLEGIHSSLFYDYCRILDLVKCIMGKNW